MNLPSIVTSKANEHDSDLKNFKCGDERESEREVSIRSILQRILDYNSITYLGNVAFGTKLHFCFDWPNDVTFNDCRFITEDEFERIRRNERVSRPA